MTIDDAGFVACTVQSYSSIKAQIGECLLGGNVFRRLDEAAKAQRQRRCGAVDLTDQHAV